MIIMVPRTRYWFFFCFAKNELLLSRIEDWSFGERVLVAYIDQVHLLVSPIFICRDISTRNSYDNTFFASRWYASDNRNLCYRWETQLKKKKVKLVVDHCLCILMRFVWRVKDVYSAITYVIISLLNRTTRKWRVNMHCYSFTHFTNTQETPTSV